MLVLFFSRHKYFWAICGSLCLHAFMVFIVHVNIESSPSAETHFLDLGFYQQEWGGYLVNLPEKIGEVSQQFCDFDRQIVTQIDRGAFAVKYRFGVKKSDNPYFTMKSFQHKQFLKNLPKTFLKEEDFELAEEYDVFEPQDSTDLQALYQSLFSDNESSSIFTESLKHDYPEIVLLGPVSDSIWFNELKEKLFFEFKDLKFHGQAIRIRFWVEKDGVIKKAILEQSSGSKSIDQSCIYKLTQITLKHVSADAKVVWGIVRISSQGE